MPLVYIMEDMQLYQVQYSMQFSLLMEHVIPVKTLIGYLLQYLPCCNCKCHIERNNIVFGCQIKVCKQDDCYECSSCRDLQCNNCVTYMTPEVLKVKNVYRDAFTSATHSTNYFFTTCFLQQ